MPKTRRIALDENLTSYVIQKLNSTIDHLDNLDQFVHLVTNSIEQGDFDAYYLGELLDAVNASLEYANEKIAQKTLEYKEEVQQDRADVG